MRQMAGEGYTSQQIAAVVGVGEGVVRKHLHAMNVLVPGDRVMGGTRRQNSNRIMDHIATDLEHLTTDLNLVDVRELDRDRLVAWTVVMKASVSLLTEFIRQLSKEQRYVEAAKSGSSPAPEASAPQLETVLGADS
jgi:hypothetical protein